MSAHSSQSVPQETTQWLREARNWCLRSGEIQLSYFGGDDKRIEHKGAIDLVTAADKACEALLIDAIKSAFPEHDYVGEEGHVKNTGAEFTWYIDPLDGTTNFAHGYPVFCTSVALVREGRTIMGIVHDPCRGETYTAIRGSGAYRNDERIQVTHTGDLKQAFLCSGFPYAFAEDPRNLALWGAFLHASQSVRRDGSAALDLCYVAAGRYDGFWELGLNSWDIAAGALIVDEAGGRATNFDGSELGLNDRNILATNGALHGPMQAILKQHGGY